VSVHMLHLILILIFFHCASGRNVNMALLPAHQRLLEDDTDDEELTDEQVRELLQDASRRMRESRAAGRPTSTSDVPFKLPKLNPGHVADTYTKTKGNITRLDSSKLVNKRDQVLANGVKKIEDPIAIKRQRQEVCKCVKYISTGILPLMITIPIFSEQTLVPFWVPSCTTEGSIIIVTLRHFTSSTRSFHDLAGNADHRIGEESYCWLRLVQLAAH
jgi:hypothetical protein